MSDSGTARFPATVRGEWKAVFHKGTRSSLVQRERQFFALGTQCYFRRAMRYPKVVSKSLSLQTRSLAEKPVNKPGQPRGGVGGAKEEDQGEHGRATHVPDTAPGKRVPEA
jgi:hypothetical protein